MEIKIEQQCHGYKGGHQLLGSSVKLARDDQDTVDRLSDVSGAVRPEEKFSPYLTSYALPTSNFYVIAKTWQDFEARRAGCVLTRSFLIDLSAWAVLTDVQGVIQRLGAIDRENVEARAFMFELTLGNPIPPVDLAQTIELVECLFLEERRPVVVFGASAADLILTRVLTALWPAMRRNFSTCSFALGPRAVSGQPFDLVFTPKELRSRFAKWEGRRIDGSGEREPVTRHRWSAVTARLIFEDPVPALSKIDALGSLASDYSGDESQLRIALLWNDLVDQSKESPTAVLGMLDILHVQAPREHGYYVMAAVSNAVQLSQTMVPQKRLEFLFLLNAKLEGTAISLKVALLLRQSFAQAASADVLEAVRLLGMVLPDHRFITRLLFAGIGQGIAMGGVQFLSQKLFMVLNDEQLVLLLAVSRSFVAQLISNKPASADAGWIERVSAAIGFPSNKLASVAKKNVVASLVDQHQAPLLKACIRGGQGIGVIKAVDLIWKRSKLTIEAFDSVLLDALVGRDDLLELRTFVLNLPENASTTRLLISSLETTLPEFGWLLHESRLSEERRSMMLCSLLEKANDSVLGAVARTNELMERLLSIIETPPPSAASLHAYLKTLAWSNLPVDRMLAAGVPMLQKVPVPLRSELLHHFTTRAMRFAESVSNHSLTEMVANDAFVVNPDHLIADAVSFESNPRRISDNIVILDRAPWAVRKEVLRHVDNLSTRLVQNHAERLNEEGVFSWSRLIADAGQMNPAGQLRAASTALDFAIPLGHLKVSSLIVVSFPLVYHQLQQGKEPSIWATFFHDWDRCKVLRKEIARKFIKSSWPPLDLLRASLPTGDLERILTSLSRIDGGWPYLRILRDHSNSLDPTDRMLARDVIDRVLENEHR